MIRGAIIAVGLLLGGCVTTQQPIAVETTEGASAVAQQTDKYIGTKRWISKQVYVCAGPPAPNEITVIGATPCVPTRSGAFTVESLAKGRVVSGYVVKFENGRTGWIKDLDLQFSTHDEAEQKRRLAEKADCNRRGGIRIGMTREQVYASCWGKPKHINKTITSGGVHEQFVYGSSYVYLEDGIVRSIQTSER